MPALSCLCCSACFLDAVGPRGWRDGCGAQVARCIGVGSTRAAGRARSTAHPDRNGRRGGWRRAVGAMRAAKRDAHKTAAMNAGEMAGGRACGKQARPAPQGAKPVRPCRVSQSPFGRTAGRCRRKAGRRWQHLNIFAPCVISGSSTRKRALGGKIRAPCILNRPIAPGNGCMGRGCCHLDLEEHAFRADVARKGAFFAHSAKKGCIRCDSCQPGPWGGRRRKAALGSGAGGAWVQDAGGGSFLAQWDGCCRRRLLRGWLCREGEMKRDRICGLFTLKR